MRIILRPLHPHVRAAQTSDPPSCNLRATRLPPRSVSHPLERHIRAARLYLSMLVVRNPTTRCPAALRPPASLSTATSSVQRPPTPSCPALSRVRPSSHRHPVHSPSFLMLGSYSRAQRASCPSIPFSLSRRRSSRSVCCTPRFPLFLSLSHCLSPSPSPVRALSTKKKKRT